MKMPRQVFLLSIAAFLAVTHGRDANAKVDEVAAVKESWKSACSLLTSPELGRYKRSKVDVEAEKDAKLEAYRVEEMFLMDPETTERFDNYLLDKSEVNLNSQKIMHNLKHLPIADHFCNPRQFTLLVDNMEDSVTCEQVSKTRQLHNSLNPQTYCTLF